MTGIGEGFFVIAVVIAVGYGIGRAGVLGPSATQVLSRTAFFVASPALLFTVIAQQDIGAVFSAGLVVTAVTSTLACALFVPFGLLRRRPAGEIAIGSMASGYVNAGNLGIPIATYALGSAGEIAPVLLFQLAVLTPLFSTVLDIVSHQGERTSRRRTLTAPLRNPLAIATAAGLVASATGWLPPEPVMAPLQLIADLAVPCMLLAFGISLRGAARPGTGDVGPSLWVVVAIKNVLQPLIGLGLGLLLGLSGIALMAVVVCAALPTAQNVFGYAVRFDQGVRLGRDAALTTTIVSVPVLFLIVGLLAV
ncbi:AEC family transporter [Pseudonocardia sp. WMMC193]|uniref:AEC family transporter n=1 Tax=Pseudonocardia sp. WMMC193 TaxID=2911965 RepID=UPI001F2A925F|nr:AEC family transporter [Pseudonocardia sp. WMMC193]MCF7551127.1 AEC family transporter [Pseudonocardia sp. WMMC193]